MSEEEIYYSDEIDDEIEETGNWDVCKVDNDYLISDVYPHPIRRIDGDRIVKEWVGKDGYVRCKLNGKQYLKHRIIAEQFIENDDNKTEIDHINHDRADNRIENLRFVSHSENLRNLSSYSNVEVEYFDTIDDETAIEITYYGKHKLEFYYYVVSDDSFYYYNGAHYRKLNINTKKQSGALFVYVQDVENKSIEIRINKFKKLYGIEF
jgi:hypothetical protein